MQKPLPDLSNLELMAKLGRQYVLRDRWNDALHSLRDAVTKVNSASEEIQTKGISEGRQALDDLTSLMKLRNEQK